MKPLSSSPYANAGRRRLGWALVLTLAAGLLAAPALLDAGPVARAADESPAPTSAAAPAAWPEAVADAWAKTPVQQGGRAMPLYAWANYALLRVNRKKSCKTPQGEKLGPVEWMLDVLFRPDLARTYRCFRIETDEILTAIGLEIEGRKKADRYSYDELAAGRMKLFTLAKRYRTKAEKDRSRVEVGVVALAHGMHEFDGLLHFLDWARATVDVSRDASLGERFGGRKHVPVSEALVPLAPGINRATEALLEASRRNNPQQPLRLAGALRQALVPYDGLGRMFSDATLLSLLPLTKSQFEQVEALHEKRQALSENPEEWLSPSDLLARVVLWPNLEVAPIHLEMLGLLEKMAADVDDPVRFAEHTSGFHTRSRELATALGEYDGIESEVTYLRANLLGWAKHFFLLAFVLVALSWLWPNRWLVRIAWALTAACALLVAIGITWRCILRGRPPVTTLYETVIFVTGSMAVAGLVLEWINPKRIALALTPLLAFAGLFVAERYELEKMEDTMPQLVAVLDTNFWLALHVTVIAIGYMASLLTGFVAHIYVLGKVFGFRKGDTAFYRNVGRMVYGLLAFALIFATIGTILGGIWANESWGRFWGWDPKENGALMIVLWLLAMVHLRLGGYVKAFGLSMMAIVLNIIVVFSWWGVNLLGIGLHSYGFTAGIAKTLYVFYAIEAFVFLLGLGWWLATRPRAAPAA